MKIKAFPELNDTFRVEFTDDNDTLFNRYQYGATRYRYVVEGFRGYTTIDLDLLPGGLADISWKTSWYMSFSYGKMPRKHITSMATNNLAMALIDASNIIKEHAQ